MLLAVDIGNSSITVGGFGREAEPLFTVRFSSAEHRTADEYAADLRKALEQHGIAPEAVTDGAIASVVPLLTQTMKAALELLGLQRVLTVGAGVKTGIAIRTDSPAELGADIIANAAAAATLTEGAAIILDIGTATTVFALNDKKELIGGAILPGIRSSLEGLRNATAQLPMVALSPKDAMGKNTADCISSGVLWGHAMAIDGFIEKFSAMEGMGRAAIFATGGPASLILPLCGAEIQSQPFLTLKGLRVIYEKTRKTKVC